MNAIAVMVIGKLAGQVKPNAPADAFI